MSAFITFLRIVLDVANGILRAVIVSSFWPWFIVPLFPTAPTLSWLHAYGLMLTIAFITCRQPTQYEKDKMFSVLTSPPTDKEKSKMSLVKLTFSATVVCVIYPAWLLVGYLFHVLFPIGG